MRHALALLLVLIGLCNGCAGKAAVVPAPPVVLALPHCPAPASPELPPLNAAEPLDSPQNAELLMERDDTLRAHIDGLAAAITCYRRGAKP